MKPIHTYLGLLATAMLETFITHQAGLTVQADATLVAGAIAMLSFQGGCRMQLPFWADGIEVPPPATGHHLAMAMIIEGATFMTGNAIGQTAAITLRVVGLLLQLAMIGKMTHDYLGEPDEKPATKTTIKATPPTR